MRRIQAKAGMFLSLLGLAILGVLLIATTHTTAAINQQINFQGKLTNPDGTNVTNGNYSIVFSLYTVPVAGTADWTETQNPVAVTDGIFQVALGSVTGLPGSVNFNGSALYLGVKVGADAEMTPRIRLTASPYAFNSLSLNGLADTAFVKLAQGLQVDASATNASIAVNKTGGTAGILQLQRAGSDVLSIANTGAYTYTLSSGDNPAYTITNNGSSNVITNLVGTGDIVFQDNGTAFLTLSDIGAVDFVLDATDNPGFTITNNGSSNVNVNLAGTGDMTFQDNGSTFLTLSDTGGFDLALDNTDNPAFLVTNAGSNNVTYNLSGTGDFVVQDSGTSVLTVNDNGSIALVPTAGQNFAISLGAGSATSITATAASTVDMLTITNSGQVSTTTGVDGISLTFGTSNASGSAINITPSFAGGATDALTYSAFNVQGFSPTNAAGTDIVRGVNIDNLTDPGATIRSIGLSVGTGWDYELEFDSAVPAIRLAATDNTAVLTVVDANNNVLLRGQDHATNFGASFEAGAFIDYNSMYSDEFFKDRAQVNGDGNQNWGDNLEWTTGETGACTWDGLADTVNGITSIVATGTGDFCVLYHSDLAADTTNLWLDADFLPTLVMKVRPSVAGAGVPDTDHQFFAGMADGTLDATPVSGAPTNGIYFSNASNTAGTTGTANWYAVTDNGGASTNTACGVAVSETGFALLIIKVMSTTLVKFYIDPDVSNGVSLTECGTGNTANINAAGMTAFLKTDYDANANASTLDVDFFRVWQDDAPQTVARSNDEANKAALGEVTSLLQSANIVHSAAINERTSVHSGSDNVAQIYLPIITVMVATVGWLYYRQRRLQKVITRALQQRRRKK